MNYKTLMDRSKRFMDAAGSTVTKFCARCGLSASMYYKWTQGMTPLSDEKAEAMDKFLKSFGY